MWREEIHQDFMAGPTARSNHATVIVNQQLYLYGGLHTASNSHWLNDLYIFHFHKLSEKEDLLNQISYLKRQVKSLKNQLTKQNIQPILEPVSISSIHSPLPPSKSLIFSHLPSIRNYLL